MLNLSPVALWARRVAPAHVADDADYRGAPPRRGVLPDDGNGRHLPSLRRRRTRLPSGPVPGALRAARRRALEISRIRRGFPCRASRRFSSARTSSFPPNRYGIDALGAMAQGLFCSLLIGTIIKTLGTQLTRPFHAESDIGAYAMAVSGPAMAVAIGYALQAPADGAVLAERRRLGSQRRLGGAGGPLAVLFIAIVAAEIRQGRLQGDEGGHPRHARGHHPRRRGAGQADRAAHRRRGPGIRHG